MPSPAHYGAQAQPSQDCRWREGVAQQFDDRRRRPFRNGGGFTDPTRSMHSSRKACATARRLPLRSEPLLPRKRNCARRSVRPRCLPSTLPAQVERARSPVVPGIGPTEVRYNFFVGQIQAHYTFDLFGATRYANAAAAARVNVQGYQLEAARRALAANIVGTAINVAALDRQIALTERLVAVANETANEDQQRYALGSHFARAGAQLDSKMRIRSAASLAGLAPATCLTRVHALAVLMGRTPDDAPADPDLDRLSLPEHVPVVVPSELLRSRPDIQAADAAVKAAAADVGAATAQLFPSLSLTASMGQGGFSWPAMLSGAGGLWAIGAGLSQPLFHGGALFAQRRASIDTYDATVLHYKSTVLSAFQNVADSLAALDNDAQTLASTERAAQAAHAAFDETASRARLGSLPSTAQHASEQRFLNAQLSAARAGSRRMSDTAALFQAMGELPADQPHVTSRE